ncbi:VOC family protein [Nonomuraea sp. SBT364]|uniref:VOC family protein n=1 Tax=Nonomuraea sp. SBT364 TaxID=1580530 RepID=UPI0007C7C095
MSLELTSCTLTVHDFDEALGFYRDVLGFAVRDDVEREGTRWVSAGPPSQPDVRIWFRPSGADPRASPGDRQAVDDLIAEGPLSRLIFRTDDCDATFERLEAAGAEVMQEPITQPDGVRDCAFLDPSGNLLRFAQARPAIHQPPEDLRRRPQPEPVVDGGPRAVSDRQSPPRSAGPRSI